MIKLDDQIHQFGHVCQRGVEAVKKLHKMGVEHGVFTHNGLEIHVYQDSTEREIAYQYQLLLNQERSSN